MTNLDHHCRLRHWLGLCYTGNCDIHTQTHKNEGPRSVMGGGRRERRGGGKREREGGEREEREGREGRERGSREQNNTIKSHTHTHSYQCGLTPLQFPVHHIVKGHPFLYPYIDHVSVTAFTLSTKTISSVTTLQTIGSEP